VRVPPLEPCLSLRIPAHVMCPAVNHSLPTREFSPVAISPDSFSTGSSPFETGANGNRDLPSHLEFPDVVTPPPPIQHHSVALMGPLLSSRFPPGQPLLPAGVTPDSDSEVQTTSPRPIVICS